MEALWLLVRRGLLLLVPFCFDGGALQEILLTWGTDVSLTEDESSLSLLLGLDTDVESIDLR